MSVFEKRAAAIAGFWAATDGSLPPASRVMAMFGAVERSLNLHPGSITSNMHILHKLQSASLSDLESYSQKELVSFLSHVLSAVKLDGSGTSDLSDAAIFSTKSIFTKNDPKGPGLRKTCPCDLNIDCPAHDDAASVETCGKIRHNEFESDFDDSDSLMDCGSPRAMAAPAGRSVSETRGEFSLLDMLDDLSLYHRAVARNFEQVDEKLELLRIQNGRDLLFLNKLVSSNDRMFERVHEMKAEVAEIQHELDLYKKERRSAHGYYPAPHTTPPPLEKTGEATAKATEEEWGKEEGEASAVAPPLNGSLRAPVALALTALLVAVAARLWIRNMAFIGNE